VTGWLPPSLKAFLDRAAEPMRSQCRAELSASLIRAARVTGGREHVVAAEVPTADAEIVRIAYLLYFDLAEPHSLQLEVARLPERKRLVTGSRGRTLLVTQLRYAERMRRLALGVLASEPSAVPQDTHIRFLATAVGMLSLGDYYELIALIMAFPFASRTDPRRQRGGQEAAMASHATVGTRLLFEADLVGSQFDVGYQTLWLRQFSEARENELRPTILQWRYWLASAIGEDIIRELVTVD
jgi:hypothetical protein